MTSQGFLTANAAQGLYLLSEPPVREVLTACSSPRGSWGFVEWGTWKGTVKQSLLQLSGSNPQDYLGLGREERKRFSDFRHTHYIATQERK